MSNICYVLVAEKGFGEVVLPGWKFTMIEKISTKTNGQGLYDITSDIQRVVNESGCDDGLCTVFISHTSASLTIQENADPSAKRDLEVWLSKLVKENDPVFTHTHEGADDMPSHIKSALTAVSLGIPVLDGRLGLGTWQGIFLWEHRNGRHSRNILVHI